MLLFYSTSVFCFLPRCSHIVSNKMLNYQLETRMVDFQSRMAVLSSFKLKIFLLSSLTRIPVVNRCTDTPFLLSILYIQSVYCLDVKERSKMHIAWSLFVSNLQTPFLILKMGMGTNCYRTAGGIMDLGVMFSYLWETPKHI